MAEGLLKSTHSDLYDVYSAGTHPGTLNQFAVKVMDEVKVDISRNHSKSLKEFAGVEFDYVVTVCSKEGESCPFFPGGKNYIHQSFEDPTVFDGGDDEIITVFRRVRDEIGEWIKETF
ncbi:protein-tyrosine-phosphatase [Methanobacterium ferruginis]|nr:protein-tyrosine-phosphatase [Methanobacterium ferruginis]